MTADDTAGVAEPTPVVGGGFVERAARAGGAPQPFAATRTFVWGLRAATLAGAALCAVVLGASRFPPGSGWTGRVVLLGLLVVVGIAAAVELWCWAGRARYISTQQQTVTQVLNTVGSRELKRDLWRAMVRRVDLPEPVRPWVGAHLWIRQQTTGWVGFLFLLNVFNLSRPLFDPEPLGLLSLPAIPLISVLGVVFVMLLRWEHRRAVELGIRPCDTAAPREGSVR